MFKLLHKDSKSNARAGEITTPHGVVKTPAFIPVATRGCVKMVSPEELVEAGTQIVLANTYHLSLRPGSALVKASGGLHRFMHWKRPVLTDSGGYQVFSLAKLCKVSDEGVEFRSHIDGSSHFFTPETVVEIQNELGADIIMPLDECIPYPSDYSRVSLSTERTYQWARRSKEVCSGDGQALFGIIQGGFYPELRVKSAQEIVGLDFPGYALGGLSVGEPAKLRQETIRQTLPFLPQARPRYIMGLGTPADILSSVEEGVDLFDCVLPTRNARNGSCLTGSGRLNLRNASCRDAFIPIDEGCSCYTCRNYTRGYLHHLFSVREALGPRLATVHNIYFLNDLMKKIRSAIEQDGFLEFKKDFLVNNPHQT